VFRGDRIERENIVFNAPSEARLQPPRFIPALFSAGFHVCISDPAFFALNNDSKL
jgi:hypothetical protein